MGGAVKCPSCGQKAEKRMVADQFQYAVGKAAVILTATIPVISCKKCDEEFTDHEAAEIKDSVVASYLANRGH